MLYENEALLAADEYNQPKAATTSHFSLLALSQALNRTSAEGFDIVAPTFDSLTVESMRHLRNPAEVLSYALDNRPRIQAERFPPRAGSPGGADVPCGTTPRSR